MSASTILTSKRTISAIACSLSLAAMAATPVAVWDGDFSPSELTKFAGYTLTDWNETHGDGYSSVTIDRNNQGLMFDATSAMGGLTVMVRYSGLAAHNSNNRVLFTSSVTSSHQYDRTGIQLKSDGTLLGLWNSSTTSNNNADNGTAAGSINGSGVMAFTYSTDGTYLYYGATAAEISSTSVWGSSGLKASGDTAIYGAGIGGMYRDSSKSSTEAAKGMTITAIAVFDKVLSASEMQSYVWPSEKQKLVIDIAESKLWSQLNVPAGETNIVLNVTGNATVTIDQNISLGELCVVSTDSELELNVAQGFTADVGAYDCSQAQGLVTLNISQGTASVSAGSDTVLNGLGIGAITILYGKRLTISETGIQKTQLTNNGTLHIVGGTEANPIEIYDNGAANTGMGVITLAANAYVRNNATNGNKLYAITGAADGSSTLVLSSGQNWGMTNGSQIRNCKVLVRDMNFWWERASAFDKTVDFDYGTITLHIGNPDSAFEIGSFTGSGSISRDNASDTLTINADRIDGELSGAPNNPFTIIVKGSHVQSITAATGSITVDGGIVRLGSQTVTSLQNGGTVKYNYSAMPTVQNYSGVGNFEVDMTGTTLVSGTQYKVVDILGVTADKVSVTGVDDVSFQLYSVADGVVLADESPAAAIWTGGSGTWTDSIFDGRAVETAGEMVTFADAKSGAESVTVTLDGPKTVDVANFTANTTSYELTGGALTGPINIIGSAPVTLKTAPVIGDGELTGSGPMVLDFGSSSVFTMSSNNANYVGEATIASGTVKMGSAKSFGNFGRAASIRVKTGATLDANGASNGATTGINNKLILEEGSTFSNSVSLGDTKFFAFYDLTVEGDATIVADTANNGLTRHYNYETYVHLGTNTLTKTGSNTFYMSAPTIDGAGTIDVTAGVLELACRNNGVTHPTFADGTFIVRSGAAINLQNYSGGANLTAKKIVIEGTGLISGVGSANVTDGVELRTTDGVVTEYPTLVTAGTSVLATGDGILAFGEARPVNTVGLAEDVGISVKMQNSTDLMIQLKLDRDPASVTVYDESGSEFVGATSSYDAGSGVLTISSALTIEAASGTVDFDDNASWNGGTKPSEGSRVIILATGAEATISVEGTYSLDAVTVTGGGTIAFSGNGLITSDSMALQSGATLTCNDNMSVTNRISLDSGTVLKLDGVQEDAEISGAGAVETYGAVTFNANNTFTGGLTVKPGSTARTIKTGIGGQGYGKNNYGQAIANLSRIVVEDGGSLDLANTADACYAITIAGKGVNDNGVYRGALYNSGAEIGDGSRQTASLTLTADAMVKAEASNNGWGLVNSGHAASVLALNGHTLTVSGVGYFPIVNANTADGTQTTGTLVADGVTLGLVGVSEKASNLAGVNIVATRCATINIATAPTALGSLTVKPSNSGTTASNWNMPGTPIPTVDTSNIDTTGLTDGQVLTIFTAPNATVLSNETISVQTSGRFTSELAGNLVKVTYNTGIPDNFMHYDFNNGAKVDTGAAVDSRTTISSVGEAATETLVASKNGKAVKVFSVSDSDRYTPYWDTLVNGTSPFHAGEVTVTTVAKLNQTGIILWGLGGAANNTAMGLVAVDANTVSVVAKRGTSTVETLATVTGTSNLTKGWHFFAVVATESETTLCVDDVFTSSQNGYSVAIGQQGQLGSFHGGAFGGSKVGADGYYLDDWRVYDTALTRKEIRKLRSALLPPPFVLHLR